MGKNVLFSNDLGTTGQTFGKYISGSLPNSLPQNKIQMAQRLKSIMDFISTGRKLVEIFNNFERELMFLSKIGNPISKKM